MLTGFTVGVKREDSSKVRSAVGDSSDVGSARGDSSKMGLTNSVEERRHL